MARQDAERRYQRTIRRWDALILVLRILHACLRIQIITLWIILAMLPVSPYVRVPDAEAGVCRYVGARGIWEPDWVASCPRVVLREHFPYRY